MEHSNQEYILRGLRLKYPTVQDRFDSVRNAAEGTFNWVFDGSQETRSRSGATNLDGIDSGSHRFGEFQADLPVIFASWLASGSGVFHIKGKPGPGKSTLMKYLALHNETGELLGTWQAPITSNYCFPNSSFGVWATKPKSRSTV
jgi:hypothetical protein